MGSKSDLVLIKDGKRLDGRKVDELRPITIKAGVLNNADGSAYLEWGGNNPGFLCSQGCLYPRVRKWNMIYVLLPVQPEQAPGGPKVKPSESFS